MHRFLEFSLWLVLLLLPPLVAVAAAPVGPEPSVGVELEDPGLAARWFALFGDAQGPSGRAWVRRRLGVALAWLLMAIGVTIFVSAACGRLSAACALLLLAVHPNLRGLGAIASPWLPAAVFTWISLLFLQAIALPTVYRRRADTWRAWGVRGLAMAGSGIALGLAATAWGRIVWILFAFGSVFLLSLVFLGVTAWRLRQRRHWLGFVERPWSWIRRSGVWAITWFVVVGLFTWIYGQLGETLQPRPEAFGIGEVGRVEFWLAWAALPGIVLLGARVGALLWYRSRISGQTVLFVALVVLWVFGPAIQDDPDPLQRLLAAPVFAASLGSLVQRLRRG